MEREKTIPITIFTELIYISSHIKYQSEITIIFPTKNGKPLRSTKENANQIYRCVRAQAELDAIRF